MALPTITRENIMIGAPKEYTPRNVGEQVIEELKCHGEAVVYVDSVTGKEVRASQVVLEVITVAEELRTLGFGVGSTVGYCSENRLEFPPTLVAALAIGATCAPLNPLYTNSELKHTMSISQPSIVFCSPFTAAKIAEVQQDLPFLKKIVVFGDVASDESFIAYNDILKRKVNISQFKPAVFKAHEVVAVTLCSSGTTGLPKCVELTHFNLNAFNESLRDQRLTIYLNEDVILGLIPFFHGYGFGMVILSLILKIKMVVMPMFQEKLFLESIQNYKVSILFAVPPLLVFLSKHPMVSEYDLSTVRLIRCGAAPLSKDVQLAVQKRLNVTDIKQGYGMTELSIACCIGPEGKNKIGSSGVVTLGMQCKIIDLETGRPLPAYKEGELCFKGPFIMKGYKNNPKATAETIDKDGWLHTGDVGYFDLEGFLFIVDRVKELIKYKGFQVAPAELEAILLTNPQIKDAAVIGVPDDEAGELPFAYVVRQPDSKITAAQIQKFVSDKVSAQKRLSGGVSFLDEIPKNPSGKILRRELRILHKNQSKSKL